MALTLGNIFLEQIKGPYRGSPVGTPLHLFRVTVPIASGSTYSTGGNQIDICTAFMPNQTTGVVAYGSRLGATAINVIWANAFGDYYDGTTSATASNAQIALASGGTTTPISGASTNNLVTVKLYTGTNGTGGAEVGNGTALAGAYGLILAVQLTHGSVLGVA